MSWLRDSPFTVAAVAALLAAGAGAGIVRADAKVESRLYAEARRLRQLAETVETQSIREARSQADVGLAGAQRTVQSLDSASQTTLPYLRAARERLHDVPTGAAAAAELRDVATRLETLTTVPEIGRAVSVDATRPADVRRLLDRELADDVYIGTDQAFFQELWAALSRYRKERIDRFLGGRWGLGIERASYVFMWVLLAVALVVLAWLAVSRYRRAPRSFADPAASVVETRRMADAEVYRVEARGHAAAGRFRRAVRARFMMTLAELEERRLVAYDRSRTNAEYLRQLRQRAGAGPLATGFAGVTRTYNRTWYGHAPCGAEDYDAFAGRVDEVVRLAKGAV